MTKTMTYLIAAALVVGLVQPVASAKTAPRPAVRPDAVVAATEPTIVAGAPAPQLATNESGNRQASPAAPIWWAIRIALAATKKRAVTVVVSRATYEKAKRAALREAMRQLKKELDELYVEGGTKLLKMNGRNFRENVRRRTHWAKKNTEGYDAHHTLPRKFEEHFAKTGINIHNPVNGHWWCAQAHRKAAKAFNKAWWKWLEPRTKKMKKTKKWRMRVETKRLKMVSNPDWAATYQCQS